MGNDTLDQIWSSQKDEPRIDTAGQVILKAKMQRRSQFIGIAVMALTVAILAVFTIYTVNTWNDFTVGLTLMISSLVFRIGLEFASLFRKENQLVALDNKSFRTYLKKHYQSRLRINYIITPICFAIYVFGFTMLLPFFKNEFSGGFYTYILISGFVSFFVLIIIIAYGILKEHRMLRKLRGE